MTDELETPATEPDPPYVAPDAAPRPDDDQSDRPTPRNDAVEDLDPEAEERK